MTQRMLVSMAHPDDESFGMAGTIARYVDQGTEVHLICSTNGDVGTVDEKFMKGYDTIAEMRLAELTCAAQTLNLTSVHTFGYRDSGMAGSADNDHPDSLVQAEPEVVTARIVGIIRQLRPQVVVTFDPYGGYGHPDHIVMHQTTTDAFHKAGDPTYRPELGDPYQAQKLYYQTFPRGWLKLTIALMPLFGQDPERFGRNKDINVRTIAEHEYPIHARINHRGYDEIAEQARRCHASQLSGAGQTGLLQKIRQWLSRPVDTFMRAYPEPKGRTRERDLFAHVEVT